MSLSSDLISQFAKITNDNSKREKETAIVYGTTVEFNGVIYVKLDGSDILTPISSTADARSGERVTVMIKNHIATITGNISSPAARTDDVKNINVNLDGVQENLDSAQAVSDENESRLNTAEVILEELMSSIASLITDDNGTSLMTQTANGWTFRTSELQNVIDSTSEGLDKLVSEVGDVENTLEILRQAVNDVGEFAEYVKIGVYEGEPSIELGESDSNFKLLITNTRMMFMEGSTIIAYISNQSMHIKKVVVEDEFYQGSFMWKTRDNGNLGLQWKGASS